MRPAVVDYYERTDFVRRLIKRLAILANGDIDEVSKQLSLTHTRSEGIHYAIAQRIGDSALPIYPVDSVDSVSYASEIPSDYPLIQARSTLPQEGYFLCNENDPEWVAIARYSDEIRQVSIRFKGNIGGWGFKYPTLLFATRFEGCAFGASIILNESTCLKDLLFVYGLNLHAKIRGSREPTDKQLDVVITRFQTAACHIFKPH